MYRATLYVYKRGLCKYQKFYIETISDLELEYRLRIYIKKLEKRGFFTTVVYNWMYHLENWISDNVSC